MDNTTLRSHLTLLGRRMVEAVRESQCHSSRTYREVLSCDPAKNRFHYTIEDVTGFWFIDRKVPVIGINCGVDDVIADNPIAVDFYYPRFATRKAQQLILNYHEVSGIRLEPRWGGIE